MTYIVSGGALNSTHSLTHSRLPAGPVFRPGPVKELKAAKNI